MKHFPSVILNPSMSLRSRVYSQKSFAYRGRSNLRAKNLDPSPRSAGLRMTRISWAKIATLDIGFLENYELNTIN